MGKHAITVERPVSAQWASGETISHHKTWHLMEEGQPISRGFATKAEATYELAHNPYYTV